MRSKNMQRFFSSLMILFSLNNVQASEIYVGRASVDITPPLPVAVDGQMHLRVAKKVDNPVTANVLILSPGSNKNAGATSIFVSCDLVLVDLNIIYGVRALIADKIPGVDTGKIVINAIHTHTAPVVRDIYLIPQDVTQVREVHRYIIDQIGWAILHAWNDRQKVSLTWGMDYAKVAYNRRATYQDGTAKMYGNTTVKEFRKIEGPEDESVNSLFFWNAKGKLLAACVNVPCPAQVVESRSTVNADYWHFVRQNMQKRFGKQVVVLGWIGAAGDQNPRPMYNKVAEYRMAQLRSGVAPGDLKMDDINFQTEIYLREIADRITDAVVRTYEAVKADKQNDVILKHEVQHIDLPMRSITAEEYWAIKKELIADTIQGEEHSRKFYGRIGWNKRAIQRYENQQRVEHPLYNAEIHVLRIGDIVICTNPFELFADYGVQMKARSEALQTFVIQLAGPGTYLPTAIAVKGGHYSAIPQSNLVGPEGGQVLVERTLQLVEDVWKEN
ncbi:MAG: hypothetical protein H3C48_11875 [Chitinophagaceae bacterium]|nr:hypothetical protein [Chitinophagaceae bacterium]